MSGLELLETLKNFTMRELEQEVIVSELGKKKAIASCSSFQDLDENGDLRSRLMFYVK